MTFDIKDITGQNFSLGNVIWGAKNLLNEGKTIPQKVDQDKAKKAQQFFLKNERTILFCASIGAMFIMSPRLLVVGAIGGCYLKIKFYGHPILNKLDPQDEILSIFETVIALLGVGGTILRQMYPKTVFEISPIFTGLALGSVAFDIYIRAGEKIFGLEPPKEGKN